MISFFKQIAFDSTFALTVFKLTTMANRLGVPRNERTKHFDVTYAIHLRVELVDDEWDELFTSSKLVEFAETATKIYMAFQSVSKRRRTAMILECFDNTFQYVESNHIHSPDNCPLSDEELGTLVYSNIKDFILEESKQPDNDEDADELEIDQQRQLFEALLDKAEQAGVISGNPLGDE